MKTPTAVLIGDIHFTPTTLSLASSALNCAFLLARQLKVPLVNQGDTLDTKAIVRAECMNELIELYDLYKGVESYTLCGNHDLINEKSEEHALSFLEPFTRIVSPGYVLNHDYGFSMIAYCNDSKRFQELVLEAKHGIVLAHQGVQGAKMGHYAVDKTSVDLKVLKGRRIISGHYHQRQDVPGTNISYLGTPYTQSFGEAHDGPKGFNILYSDGSLELVPLDLPKHVIAERAPTTVFDPIEGLKAHDHLMMKVTGTEEELRLLNKQEIGMKHLGHSNFRLDLIPTEIEQITKEVAVELTEAELLDSLIEALDGTPEYKQDLKETWRGLVK
jgi:DNA repair exonuclease SbcCD nuclease subunit